ncbi:unnamed protein product [Camellia sinensis]
MESRGRRCRETSPDRAKVCVKPRVVVKPTLRKVQVVYYLSRNGHLEHPHYMEVTHLSHQHLRLKDVMDRLTVLRGKGMPSLYSWSCKRSYKNGYVWNDLSENDVIYASEGAEYVLKGSELLDGSTEQFKQLEVSSRSQQVPDPTNHPKRKHLAPKRHSEPEEVDNINRYEDEDDVDNEEEDEEEDEEEEEEEEDKTSYTSSVTPTQYSSRCSRGVSTEETATELNQHDSAHKNNPTSELTLDNSSPPSATSSVVSDKANDTNNNSNNNNNTSKRFEDGDPVTTESTLSRGSVLLQLISCGGSTSFRGKTVPVVKEQSPPPPLPPRKSGTATSLHKGVLCKTAAKVVVVEEEMIRCMSENPRFGNSQGEEKEYFSGSIVESSMAEERVQVQPGLQRSSSYNEERSCKAGGVGEEAVEKEEVEREKPKMKGKCIPINKMSSTKKHPKK